MIEILPAILGYSIEAVKNQCERMSFAPMLHLDVVVPPLATPPTPYRATDFLDWEKTDLALHLMTKEPVAAIAEWQILPQVKRFYVHFESGIKTETLAELTEHYNIYLSVNAETPLTEASEHIKLCQGLQLMGVKLGRAGQNRVPGAVERVKQARALWPEIIIGFDGGLKANKDELVAFKMAGVTSFSMGAAFIESDEPAQLYQEMKSWLN